MQKKSIPAKTPNTPNKTPSTQNQKNTPPKTTKCANPNIELKYKNVNLYSRILILLCFVARQLLSRIYALFGVLFTGLILIYSYGVVPKMTNMRYGCLFSYQFVNVTSDHWSIGKVQVEINYVAQKMIQKKMESKSFLQSNIQDMPQHFPLCNHAVFQATNICTECNCALCGQNPCLYLYTLPLARKCTVITLHMLFV